MKNWIKKLIPNREAQVNKYTVCLNCSTTLDLDKNFCFVCGQKNKASTITIWTLFSEMFSNIFNLDNNIWRSAIGVFKPAYLTKEYIKGKRKSYLNPLRLFFVTMVVHFAILTSVMNIDFAQELTESNIKQVVKKDIQNDFTTYVDSLGLDQNADVDTLKKILFNSKNKITDTIRFEHAELGGIDLKNYPLARKDIYEMPPDSLLSAYNINGFYERLIIGQYVRGLKDLKGAIVFVVGNMIWSIVLTIVILSLIMKFLYIRNKVYYVEHMLVLFNIHSFCFLILIIPLLLFKFDIGLSIIDNLTSFIFLILSIYSFWTIKSYYNQGIFKSLIKSLIIGIAYMFIITLSVTLVIFLSALIF